MMTADPKDAPAPLPAVFRALAHAERLHIMSLFVAANAHDPGACLSITQVAELAEVSRFCASRHLAILREAGFLTAQRDGNFALHALSPVAPDQIDEWISPLLETTERLHARL